ncbi:MAG: phosphatidylinositol kinase, partial [Candidatus Korobacteraceae bacterium]
FPESSVWPLAEEIPPEWYGSEAGELEKLLCKLLERRARVRELTESFRKSSRNPFPNWRGVVN